MSRLNSSLRIKDKEVKNRIEMPPMVMFKKEESPWEPDQTHIDYYSKRARAGCGIVVVEATAVHPHGRLAPFQLRLWDDSHIPHMSLLAKAIKAEGALALVQIHHAGCNTYSSYMDGFQPVSPSTVKARRPKAEEPRALTSDEITMIVQSYASAAVRAIKAGFDGVEIHGAHGYLLSQFLSPAYNLRADEWGGPEITDRMRFPLAVVKAVREAVGPQAIVAYRLGAVEHIEDGLTIEDGVKAAIFLEATGCLDLLSVSNGMGGGEWPPLPEGFAFSPLMNVGATVKASVSLPVVAVGGIRSGFEAEAALSAGICDIVAVGKALLADPNWAAKALGQNSDEIVRCLQCKRCTYFSNEGVCAASKVRF